MEHGGFFFSKSFENNDDYNNKRLNSISIYFCCGTISELTVKNEYRYVCSVYNKWTDDTKNT